MQEHRRDLRGRRLGLRVHQLPVGADEGDVIIFCFEGGSVSGKPYHKIVL